MSFLLHNFVALTATALVLGAVYALVALGYTLVYGVLRLINFANDAIFMWGSFAAVWVLMAVGAGGRRPVRRAGRRARSPPWRRPAPGQAIR